MCDSDKTIVVSKDKLQTLKNIIKDAGNTPVYALFYSPGCGYCKMFKPIFESYRRNCKEGKAILAIIDLSNPGSDKVFSYYKINGYPQVIMWKNNKEIRRVVGANEGELRDAFALAGL